MKGVFNFSDLSQVHWVQGSYGNYLPSIPVVSAISSFCTIILTCFNINLTLPLATVLHNSMLSKCKIIFTDICAYLPFFLCTISFRILSLSLMWIYIAFYSLIPISCLVLSNILVFYLVVDDKRIRKKTKVFNKKLKMIQQTKCKSSLLMQRVEPAIWLSSFIAVFVPCCFIKSLDVDFIHSLQHHENILEEFDSIRESFKLKILKIQQLIGTLINLITVFIVFIIVNYTSIGYMENKLNNNTFNVYCTVLVVLGILCFLPLTFNISITNLMKLNRSWIKKGTSKTY